MLYSYLEKVDQIKFQENYVKFVASEVIISLVLV